ncbi:MAG: transcriptional regulator PpsR [Pseudomonadota bacterium]
MSKSLSADTLADRLTAESASQLIMEANDICLMLDNDGVITDVFLGTDDKSLKLANSWRGQSWFDTASVESANKIKDLLADSTDGITSRWRQINHPTESTDDLPVTWKTLRLNDHAGLVAIGRNLRQVSQLQQRLLDVQHSLERDYARLHQAEVRYRMLFSMATEAILFVDADSRKIVEANPAAGKLLDRPANKLVNRTFPRGFTDNSHDAIDDLLLRVRAAGGGEDLIIKSAKTGDGESTIRLNATLVRRDDGPYFLIRMQSADQSGYNGYSNQVIDIIDRSPDAFVVTDPHGRVQAANKAFLNLAAMATVLQVSRQPLDRWLGRTGVDVSLLLRNLKDRSEIRQYDTTFHPEYGEPIEVELSGVSALDSDEPCYGFVIRRRMKKAKPAGDDESVLPHSLKEMTELVGRVPLKELVRETTDIIERMCIEAALKMSDQSRASAAEMLGLSRQSLYVKLRRYGIGEDESEGGA